MIIRNTDKNNDWLFGNGQFNYRSGLSSTLFDIKLRLQEWQNDCFFALQNGIPWKIRLGGKNQKTLLDNDVINVVKNTQGVFNVLNFTSELNGRRYSCKMDVFTEYSNSELSFDLDLGFIPPNNAPINKEKINA